VSGSSGMGVVLGGLIWVVPSVGERTPTMTLRAARAQSRRWDIGRNEPL
jgi:hypothetical protein